MGAGSKHIQGALAGEAFLRPRCCTFSAEVESEVILPAAVSSIIAYSVYSFDFGFDPYFYQRRPAWIFQPVELILYTLEALCWRWPPFCLSKPLWVGNFLPVGAFPDTETRHRELSPALLPLLLIEVTHDFQYGERHGRWIWHPAEIFQKKTGLPTLACWCCCWLALAR